VHAKELLRRRASQWDAGGLRPIRDRPQRLGLHARLPKRVSASRERACRVLIGRAECPAGAPMRAAELHRQSASQSEHELGHVRHGRRNSALPGVRTAVPQ
jgi:hypothetical protein